MHKILKFEGFIAAVLAAGMITALNFSTMAASVQQNATSGNKITSAGGNATAGNTTSSTSGMPKKSTTILPSVPSPYY